MFIQLKGSSQSIITPNDLFGIRGNVIFHIDGNKLRYFGREILLIPGKRKVIFLNSMIFQEFYFYSAE